MTRVAVMERTTLSRNPKPLEQFAFQGLGLSLYFASQGAGTVGWPVAATVLRFVVRVVTAASLRLGARRRV